TISDLYADRIFQGQEALVKINNQELKGRIVTIQPAVTNGFIAFTVALSDKSNTNLRPHLKVDVYPIIASKKDVILLPNEAAFTGASEQVLFVIKEGKAYRKDVTTGLSNYEYIEILTGIDAGDEVIVSNMKEYKRRKSIPIKP
ncbi:efflux RND transporter periplasmic adaptor subunit, partial [Bacteroidota bacterium]